MKINFQKTSDDTVAIDSKHNTPLQQQQQSPASISSIETISSLTLSSTPPSSSNNIASITPNTESKKSMWNFSVSKLSPRRSCDITNFDKIPINKKSSISSSSSSPNNHHHHQLPLLDLNQQENSNYKLSTQNLPSSPNNASQLHHQIPEIVSRTPDCTVQTGSTVILSCRIRNHEISKITWRKTEPNPTPITQSTKFNYKLTNNGDAKLIISHTSLSDSGLYVCAVSNRFGTTQCTIGLTVQSTTIIDPINESNIEILNPTTVRISWTTSTNNLYTIEYCRIGTIKWLQLDEKPSRCRITIGNLLAGESYTFRLVCLITGVASLPSAEIVMPLNETHMWQQQQFVSRYSSLSELGRGRFSVVRLASDMITGQHVALKQISRRHQDLGTTQEEYKLLASAQHPNIVRSLALFENAPNLGNDTIVMEL